MHEPTPLEVLARAAYWMSFCLVWTVAVPGVVAKRGSVFYAEQLRLRLPPAAADRLKTFDEEQRLRRAAVTRLEQEILALTSRPEAHVTDSFVTERDRATTLSLLLQAHSGLHEELEHAAPPVTAIPFYLNPQLWLWPAIYFAMGLLIWPFAPSQSVYGAPERLSAFRFVLLSVALYLFYQWPLWCRNILFSGSGRTVFAYPNLDIHPASFAMQEAVVVGFCILVAALWDRWLSIPLARPGPSDSPFTATLDQTTTRMLSTMLFEWQYRSIILAVGFGFFSNFFWQLVFRYNDQRYVISAVNAHLLWAVSWIAISLPLLTRWQQWEQARSTTIVAVLADTSLAVDQRDKLVKAFSELRPGGFGTLMASAFLALGSFVLPFIKELIR